MSAEPEINGLAATIAHRVLDYLNSSPSEDDGDERDDWCAIRDIARSVLTEQTPARSGK